MLLTAACSTAGALVCALTFWPSAAQSPPVGDLYLAAISDLFPKRRSRFQLRLRGRVSAQVTGLSCPSNWRQVNGN